jgi:hypothetical protein
LDTCADVDRLFRMPAIVGFPKSADIRWGEELQREFAVDRPNAKAPELSLELPSNLIPLEGVVAVWVDPLVAGGTRLIDAVAAQCVGGADGLRVRPRYVREDARRAVFSDLARTLADGPARLRLLAGRVDVSEATRAWARAMVASDLEWQYDRFGRYLAEGTIEPLKQMTDDHGVQSDGANLIERLEQGDWRVGPVVRTSDPTLIPATDPTGEPMTLVVYRSRRRVARREVESMIEIRRARDLGWRRWALISDSGFSTDARILAEAARMEMITLVALETAVRDRSAVMGRA